MQFGHIAGVAIVFRYLTFQHLIRYFILYTDYAHECLSAREVGYFYAQTFVASEDPGLRDV